MPLVYTSSLAQVLALTGVSANIQLQPGKYYRLWSSVDAFFDVGPTNGVTATVNSHPITGKLDYLHSTDGTNVWLAAIAAVGSGTLYISLINV